MCSTLEQMHEEVEQESANIQNKIALTLCNIDCLREVIEQEGDNCLHQGTAMVMV